MSLNLSNISSLKLFINEALETISMPLDDERRGGAALWRVGGGWLAWRRRQSVEIASAKQKTDTCETSCAVNAAAWRQLIACRIFWLKTASKPAAWRRGARGITYTANARHRAAGQAVKCY